MTDADQVSQTEQRAHSGRKIYLVPLILDMHEAPPGYAEKVEAYWLEIGDHISRLEGRFGQVRKIYHESVPLGGEEGMKLIERLNARAYRMLDRKRKKGAELVAIEEPVLLEEVMDWRRCMAVVSSESVFRQVSAPYYEANRKRLQALTQRINEDLQDEEVAVLIVGQEHALQFPADIQVFYVAPPGLDEVQRALREALSAK